MVQRYKFYKELKNFPPDLSGEPKPVFNVMFNNVDVAKAKIGLSFENALDVTIGSSHIGGKVGTPTTVTPHDNLFGKEK